MTGKRTLQSTIISAIYNISTFSPKKEAPPEADKSSNTWDFGTNPQYFWRGKSQTPVASGKLTKAEIWGYTKVMYIYLA